MALAPGDRIVSLDILRGLALFGVLMVNLETEFRVSIFAQFLPAAARVAPADRRVELFVRYALEMKAFALFSLLFGIGMAVQFERLARGARPLYWLRRRLLVLLGFGIVHLLFVWNGDILTEYALAGLLVLPLIREDAETLAVAALGTFGFYVAMPALHLPIAWPDSDSLARHVDAANRVYPHADLLTALQFSMRELQLILPLHEFVFPRTLSLMLLGAWIWKSGRLEALRRHRRACAINGIAAVAFGVALTAAQSLGAFSITPAFGTSMSNLATTVQALGYAALLLAAVQLPVVNVALRAFAPLGRMSLTNYVAQSILFNWIFLGYGLGRFGRLSVTAAFELGSGVFVAQLLMSTWWLRRHRYGPLEALWRYFTYGRTRAHVDARSAGSPADASRKTPNAEDRA